jgi:hypothetical protein
MCRVQTGDRCRETGDRKSGGGGERRRVGRKSQTKGRQRDDDSIAGKTTPNRVRPTIRFRIWRSFTSGFGAILLPGLALSAAHRALCRVRAKSGRLGEARPSISPARSAAVVEMAMLRIVFYNGRASPSLRKLCVAVFSVLKAVRGSRFVFAGRWIRRRPAESAKKRNAALAPESTTGGLCPPYENRSAKPTLGDTKMWPRRLDKAEGRSPTVVYFGAKRRKFIPSPLAGEGGPKGRKRGRRPRKR